MPLIRVTTLARPGSDSRITGSRPTLAEQRGDMLGGGAFAGPRVSPELVVSILIRSRHRAATSSCAVGVAAACSAWSVTC